MGGFGSGCWHRWGSKRLVEDALCLDINFLARRRLLIPEKLHHLRWRTLYGEIARAEIFMGAHPEEPILFVSLNCGNHGDKDFGIPLRATPQHFGGRRWWLHCPLCSRRFAKLYLPPGEPNFGCRTCHALTYWSTKSAHQAQRARASIRRM